MTDEPNNLPGPACLPLADPNPPRLTPTEPHLFQLRLLQLSDDPYDEPKTLGTIHGAPWSITPAAPAMPNDNLTPIMWWPNPHLDPDKPTFDQNSWMEIGTISAEPFSTLDEDTTTFGGWSMSTSRSESFQVTFTHVAPNFARIVLGSDQRIPMLWPRMKYRARRRHLGYTRTGNRR